MGHALRWYYVCCGLLQFVAAAVQSPVLHPPLEDSCQLAVACGVLRWMCGVHRPRERGAQRIRAAPRGEPGWLLRKPGPQGSRGAPELRPPLFLEIPVFLFFGRCLGIWRMCAARARAAFFFSSFFFLLLVLFLLLLLPLLLL